MIQVTKETVKEVANNLTRNSELFGDEVMSVTGQLMELVNSAEEYGCEMYGQVRNYWGNTYDVVAVPKNRKTHWVF